ncbi:EF-hand domain-containing protein [Mesorhizobium sp. M7A.F.Ca.CA.001.09.2.1]|uniref:EF-hand domain-containing protein n=4 Tax=Mesorhizobium TaxID=68287 RepID=A0AB38TLR9_9HYPH|nr:MULTISPECIES: EF-hand domain-containing protein [Mesorhizobium]RUY34544.1 EF-hand domain-containing protein [Mesorhizobium sp. M7A.F.Ca.CA.001.13.2.1]MDF3217279.1 EF-hand domain-containing protein [Mesorhizobium ciceri]RUY60347.1 EF-hand domain-containing protein [Mesorhizobium sp. M7A.F.Ca.CA.001.05.1.1]RUY62757.1 EF-hand domain-containing protein [Mesorhizobium sp. M7A.F.Ca.CA.001.13.1.1]RUY79960.1 EF-hand domain-containing protein [Mesorhizobium sp. M7A.F.Ca.CA.001.09.2.1]
MRHSHVTTAAAAFIALTFPALAQTSGTPAPSTPAPPPATEQPVGGQLPDINRQADGPTREMIRQMVEQAVRERMKQDRGSEEGFRDEEDRYMNQDGHIKDADRPDESSRHGDHWLNRGDWGRGHRMARHRGHQMMRGAGMRLVFGLLDTDGDGSLSQNEVEGGVGRIFSNIDENGDGKIDLDEIQSFMHGSNMHGRNSEDMP